MFKKIALFLAAITLFGCMAGCTEDNSKSTAAYDQLYSFESYKDSIVQLKSFNEFGVIDLNTDSAFVKEGKGSCKLLPIGTPDTTKTPTVVFSTVSLADSDYSFDYMDFTKYKSVSAWVYNDEEHEVKLDISLLITTVSYDRLTGDYGGTTIADSFTLLSKQWNKVVYKINHSYLELFNDVKYIYGVCFSFENSGSRYAADADVLYVDDMKLEKLETPYVSTPATIFDCAGTTENVWMLADFENDAQKYYAHCPIYRWQERRVDLDLINPKLGDHGNVLRVLTRYCPYNGNRSNNIYIADEVMSKYDLSKMVDTEEYTYFIKFDAYNDSDYEMSISGNFTHKGTNQSCKTWTSVKVQPHTWGTFSYRLNNLTTSTTDAFGNVTKYKFMDDPGVASIGWNQYEQGPRRAFFVDNIRIEKVANA